MAIRQLHRSQVGDRHRLVDDRLSRVLACDPVWARRVRVLLVAGVLALPAGATGTSIASEVDDQQEGVVVPDPGTDAPGGDSQQSDGAPGQGSGSETALPFEVDPVVTVPGETTPDDQDDSTALEVVPLDDPDGRLPLSDPAAPDPQALAPDEGPNGVVAPVAPSPTTEAVPPAAPVAPTEQDGAGDAPRPDRGLRSQPMHRAKWTRADEKRPAHKVDVRARRAPQPVATTPAAEPQSVATPAEPTSTNLPRLRGRSHVVRPGESLWSIAAARLGPEASAGAIAREVRRLWKLNQARIGTGDPSVLPIGVHLRLR